MITMFRDTTFFSNKDSAIKSNVTRFTHGRCNMKSRYIYLFLIIIAIVAVYAPPPSVAQNMDDYTAYPPFIASNADPNLLLIIDNSGSMYDLSYVDEGNAPTREASYCYDQTYSNTNTYAGYFEKDIVYTYNFTSKRFAAGAFPASCSHRITGELCVNIVSGSPSTVSQFSARGNYLNWLTSSKFDVQKQILTGGKYSTATSEFLAESRGCVGRRFIKEALTANYVEGGTNTSLGVTFAITGPNDSINPTAPSPGGQTYIQIFQGNYNEALCQAAITSINDANNPSAIRVAVSDCLSYDPNASGTNFCALNPVMSCSIDSDCLIPTAAGNCSGGSKGSRTCLSPASMVGQSCVVNSDCNTYDNYGPCTGSTHSASVNSKIVFNQSMQECWQIWSGTKTVPGHDAWTAESAKCAEVYAGYKICNGGTKDGDVCSADIDCTGGGSCDGGPSALRPGNPGIMCNSSYTGYCASTSNDWVTTTWVPREYATAEACFIAKYSEYCGDVKVPQVIDPSDTPDDTAQTANVPAIIADIGIEAQLGAPILEARANRYATTAPTGLIDDYSNSIRFGAMSFNFDGSYYECGLSSSDSLNCPRVCSITTSRVCNESVDCPSGESCVSSTGNKDGAKIIHYIGDGTCSATPSTTCVRDDQCPIGEKCVATVGNHGTGLIKAIDDIKANTWTPYAEAFYNAIAYFVKDADNNTKLDSAKYSASADAIQNPLNTGDFTADKNPIEISCQTNNILLISDGASTTDLNSAMKSKVTQSSHLFDDGDATDPSSCGSYSGSSYLDDLSYYAKNRNIFDPSDSVSSDDDQAQRITTYVVYTGSDASTLTGECAPKTLMENTALNGGTFLYHPEDPSALASALQSAFAKISSDRSSGTAVSVLSTTGEGEGAIYQAYFYPSKKDEETGFETRKWIGYVHALYADEYGNIREDTNGNKALDMIDDLIIEMSYDPISGSLANRYTDTNGDGEKDTLHSTVSMGDVASLWKGGETLWSTDPANRTIYASTTGLNLLQFSEGAAATFRPYLRAADDTEARNIINWMRGYDFTDSKTGSDFKAFVTDAGHPLGYRQRSLTPAGQTETHVWKLGDIIYSTPTAVGRPMENFDMLYHDYSYYSFLKKYINRRTVVYIGANDGMLHAFNGGFFSSKNHQYCTGAPDGNGDCTSGSYSLGQELWGFIPRGLLPHLKWLTDPAYTHVYYVDLKPKITDVKIFNNDSAHPDGWGTILIGGYRYGGKDISWTSGSSNYSASTEYFALDITDPMNPRLLWTFSDPQLGLGMSYPAVAKVGTEWFAVFGSGAADFEADSDLGGFQNGNIYTLQLSGGSDGVINSWSENTNFWKISTGNAAAFMSTPVAIDVDMDFNTDVIYIGESYRDGINWNGIMHRITTVNGTDSTPPWSLSTLANINNIAGDKDIAKKITAAPSAAMDDHMTLWTFFGTGQFQGLDDRNQSDTGAFYAIKDRCWRGTCSDSYTELMDVSAATVKTDETVSGVSTCSGAVAANSWNSLLNAANTCDGWAMYFKNLGETADFLGNTLNHNGERVVTKPLVTGGLVAFGAYVPGTGCDYLGESNAYAVYYKTGTAYSHYLFKEQSEMVSPSEEVARTIRLGEGMPSSPSGQREKDGTVKVYFQQSTGRIVTAEHGTPINIKSSLKGWKSEQMP
jgi:type IV pilus assembly protein PilY1